MFLPLQILIIVMDDAIEELHSCLEVYSRNTSILLSPRLSTFFPVGPTICTQLVLSRKLHNLENCYLLHLMAKGQNHKSVVVINKFLTCINLSQILKNSVSHSLLDGYKFLA